MLSKDVLGTALYNARAEFDGKTVDDLIAEYGDLEAARLAVCIADADAIITHFKNNSLLSIPGTGMVAGSNVVTGVSITGTIS